MMLMLPFVWLSYTILNGKQANDVAFKFLNVWAFGFNTLMGYRYKIFNREFVKKDNAYIFVVNHNSYLDALAVVRVIPQSFKPLGKIEMAKIPIFGFIYKRLVVLIDRSSKESRDESVLALKKQIAIGQSILIFPEGTMNKTTQHLTDFYDGAFKIAIETQTSILPLTIINTKELMPRLNPTSIKPGLIKCVFSPEFQVKGLTLDDLPQLKAKVFAEMEAQLMLYKGLPKQSD
ncbi:MAG: 1-acyl-sn-glycerol-3-phosphate acyltransferase [Bacteroidetes bacterium]|nr:1-acyl-sn-glycerol-3-phosphate acyltransferase [Bacteroidota bacterium]